MSKTIFYNNPVFRLSAPLLTGIVIYLLILMFFDSVDMLAENFFSREVVFTIGLTYLFFELNRLVIILTNRIGLDKKAFLTRLAIQYALAVILTPAAISLVMYLYFSYVEGFSTITTELLIFNGIYLFATLFYHLYFFSIYFLHRRNDELLREEKMQRSILEHELSRFRNQINPTFLFRALEIIIGELHHNKKHADELIGHLAAIYRYTLDNQQNELAGLVSELNSLAPAADIFRALHPDALFIHDQVEVKEGAFLVPGTLLTLFEHAVINNLIGPSLPLHFKLTSVDGTLVISHDLNARITDADTAEGRIRDLVRAYENLTDRPLRIVQQDHKQHYEIPLLLVEEE